MRILIPTAHAPFAHLRLHGASASETLAVLAAAATLSVALAPQILSLVTRFIVG